MNRRRVLGAIGTAGILLAGCLGAADESQDPATGEEATTTSPESDLSRPESSTPILQVSINADVPDDIDPIDAVDAGLTEHEQVAAVLAEASDAYEAGMEDDLGEPGFQVLASVSGGFDPDELPAVLESGAEYVTYEDVVYFVAVVEFSLEVN
ncbi:hypothetical protein [Natrialba sp. SSL1]|uniref:hypothetical protein n=1 Tax=Natrialba sp. SSL1 TaxID=1869245 RepID=UPI0008F86400|nr:hypothetical protein [Natrialba sp. SSL1]OIB58605.1 hypothetical protein BBD46_07165 [Natrialba sp. SSL1]